MAQTPPPRLIPAANPGPEPLAFFASLRLGEHPYNLSEVPIRDKDGGPILDENGKPTTEDLPLPVDMRPVKDALLPIYKKYERTMPSTDARASWGLKAIRNILDEGDFKSASTAEMDLGAIKEAARAELPELRDVSQGLAAQAVKELDTAIREAVSNARVEGFDGAAGGQNPALKALLDGRKATAEKWEVADTLKSFGRKIEDLEPVQVFQQLTWGRDSGIQRLREIAKQAPDRMPDVGRAYVEGLLETATREGGFDKTRTVYNEWQKLGPETKKVLFRNPGLIGDLDNFFTLAKKAAENPNPSGTAHQLAVMAQTGLVFTNPATGIPYVIGTAALAKLLHSPRAAAILTEGLRVPLGGSRAVVTANALSRLADEQGGTPPTPDRGAPSTGGSDRPTPGGAPAGVQLRRQAPDWTDSKNFPSDPKGALDWIRQQKKGYATFGHEQLGSVGFAYGWEGVAPPKWKKGFGVSHIDIKAQRVSGHDCGEDPLDAGGERVQKCRR